MIAKGDVIGNPLLNGRVSYLLSIILGFVLPFNFYFIPTIIIILLSIRFIEVIYHKDSIVRPKTPPIIYACITAIYFLHLFLITISSENISYGFSKLETKLPLLSFAIFFLIPSEFYKRHKRTVLLSMSLGAVAASLACLVIALAKSIKFDGTLVSFNSCALPGSYSNYPFLYLFQRGWSYFSYGFFSVFNHPSYFSIYLVFCLCVLLVFKQDFINFLRVKKTFLFYATVALIILAILLLQSKANIIALVLVLLYFTIAGWAKFKLGARLLITISIISGVTIIASKSRFVKVIEVFEKPQLTDLEKNRDTYEGTALRVFIWHASWEIIQKNLWLGVGLGDTKSALQGKYREMGLKYAEKWELNAHNQFLESFLAGGVIGLTLLLILLITPFIQAIRSKNKLFIAFILIITTNLLFESFFYRQSGVVFYSFFIGFLYLESSEQQVSSKEKQ